jgi:hypothetical protein
LPYLGSGDNPRRIDVKHADKDVGHIDYIEGNHVFGSACDEEESRPALLSIYYDGELKSQIVADRYRVDLENAGIGDGHRAFEVPMPCDPSNFRPKLFQARLQDGRE